MTYGPQALSDQELLAVFLRTGVQGKNALDLGREILDYFGSLGKLFSASPDALDHFKGIGPAKIALIQAVMELARRTSSEELKRGPVLVSSHAVNRFLQSQFAGEQSESFIGLFLDVQHRLIACERMFQGTLTRTCVYPREVARLALAHNAAAVIFAHNHPSGSPQPSAMDKALTAQLKELMQTIEVAMLDHVIVCGTRFWSFREKGLC
jgi:DNA repair protein RadC